MHAFQNSILLLLVFLAAACSESDASALRLRFARDLSGSIDVSTLSLPDDPAPIESASSGVEWSERARISYSSGRFESVRSLQLADLRFEAEPRSDGLSYVRVHLPRGEQAQWFRLLTTTDEERRQQLVRAMDSSGGADKVGAKVKLVIETPDAIVSASADPSVRGAKSETKKGSATLELTVEALSAGAGEIVWTVIW